MICGMKRDLLLSKGTVLRPVNHLTIEKLCEGRALAVAKAALPLLCLHDLLPVRDRWNSDQLLKYRDKIIIITETTLIGNLSK